MDMASVASPFALADSPGIDPAKFLDPVFTARGERRATVALDRLETLWINTGTLCNLACRSCYIHSSPTNDALVYLTLAEAEPYFEEAGAAGARVIGFTGGEPFMNPDMIAMMGSALERGFELLILTNAMRPMQRFQRELAELGRQYGDRVVFRVSLDHHDGAIHEIERGEGSWEKALAGLRWLSSSGFRIAIAGRRLEGDFDPDEGYQRLLAELALSADHLVLFPTMDEALDVPEISEGCWDILKVSPSSMMCATSRMVVKARGAERPHVVACTLLPHDIRFAMGSTLEQASGQISLNHPHCARFCVLGGASCSG